MVTWTRDTPWRQGSLISRVDLETLGVPLEADHAFGLVISFLMTVMWLTITCHGALKPAYCAL